MILTGYISNATGGAKRIGCVSFARDLMRGDAETFKAGYTAENAYIALIERAAAEGVELSDRDREVIAGKLDIAAEKRERLEGIAAATRGITAA